MSKTNIPRRRLLTGFLFFLAIFTLSLFFVNVESLNLPEAALKLQDASHIFIFLMFGYLLFAAIKRSLVENAVFTFLILFIVSYLIEVLQGYVGRTFQLEDIVRNMLGVSLSIFLLLCIKSKSLIGKALSVVGLLITFVFCYLELAPAFRQALEGVT